jgi:hypothetical protein
LHEETGEAQLLHPPSLQDEQLAPYPESIMTGAEVIGGVM